MRRIELLAAIVLIAAPAAAQNDAASGAWTPPRMPDGRPDLQGFWTTQTFTPLQRPEQFAGREFLTEEEMAALTEALTADGVDPLRSRAFTDLLSDDPDRRDTATAQADPTHYNNEQWLRTDVPKGLSSRRTSLIVDPPDGRIPPPSDLAQDRAAARRAASGYDGYQSRPAQERCLVWTHEGPPMMPPPYNDLYLIMQAPGVVVLFPEMANNLPRIVPTDGRAHVSDRIRQWPGHSVGRWDGDTLVVDTTNFSSKTAFQGASERLHVVERFTRVDEDTILYEFTVADPATWDRSWTAELPMLRSEGPLFEYTCHEGNYGMENTLRGARRTDRMAADQEAGAR